MVKKSYNPFKMWGSYIGAILFLIILGFFITNELQLNISFYTGSGGLIHILSLFGIITMGFISGWIIHSLIRRYK